MADCNPTVPYVSHRLGKLVGEKFKIKDFSEDVVFMLNSDGTFTTDPENAPGSSLAFLHALENPHLVISLPQLTPEQITFCEMLGAEYVTRDEKRAPTSDFVCLWGSCPKKVHTRWAAEDRWLPDDEPALLLARVFNSCKLFDSVLPDTCLPAHPGEAG